MRPHAGRNDPCPCGSGKKFKKCCGSNPPSQRSGSSATAFLVQAAELHRLGRLAEAADLLQRATRLAPDDPSLHTELADLLIRHGQHQAAAAALARVVALDPDNYAAHYNLATLHKQSGDLEKAAEGFRQAAALHPLDADTHNNLGNTLAALGRHDEAIPLYETAIRLNPNLQHAHTNLATSLQAQGDFEGAAGAYLRVLDTVGDSALAYRGLSASRKFGPHDRPLIDRMEAYAGRPELSDGETADIQFALGKVYDDLGEYPRAFQHYALGNELARRWYSFHLDEWVLRAEHIMRVFSRDFLALPKTWSNPSARPVIIVGMPRSGTSLVEQILASHPAVFGAGELDFWRIEDDKQHPRYLRALPKRGADIAQRYLDLLKTLSPETDRVIDKLPGNFWHLGLIHALFPNARVIHCRRNPVDTCLSIYFQKFAGDHPYAYDLTELADYYRLYRRLTKYWRSVLPVENYAEVQYEDLVANQEAETRRLVEFLGLEWSERCLDFYRHQRAVKTASSWQVRQPVYTTSRERWRNYEAYITPLIKLLDDSDTPSNSPTRPRTPTRPRAPGSPIKRAA